MATVICHMMASLDGRIDCDMTSHLGSKGYYEALEALKIDTTVERKVTALHHYASGTYTPIDPTSVGKPEFFKSHESEKWAVIADTRGTLVWPETDDKNRLCLVSELAPREYLDYLKKNGISYIAVGKKSIDLREAVRILETEFGSQRIGVVGGGHINGSFLEAGLINEVSMVYGAGIDGRSSQPTAFEGISESHTVPYKLTLQSVEKVADQSVWIRYTV